MLYFAYGSNMKEADMARRCPGARPCGRARLDGYRLFAMREGYVSARVAPHSAVHGLLWALEPRDVARLDLYEQIGRGWYAKLVRRVASRHGRRRALVYAAGRAGLTAGRARLAHLRDEVIAPALAAGLPARHIAALGRLPVR